MRYILISRIKKYPVPYGIPSGKMLRIILFPSRAFLSTEMLSLVSVPLNIRSLKYSYGRSAIILSPLPTCPFSLSNVNLYHLNEAHGQRTLSGLLLCYWSDKVGIQYKLTY